MRETASQLEEYGLLVLGFHSAFERAHRARGWLRAVAGRSIGSRSCKIEKITANRNTDGKYQAAGYRGNAGGTLTDLLPPVTPLLPHPWMTAPMVGHFPQSYVEILCEAHWADHLDELTKKTTANTHHPVCQRVIWRPLRLEPFSR